MEAKAGDKIAPKARAALAKAMAAQLRVLCEDAPQTVCPKTEGGEGQWFCITCGEFPRNNLEASLHTDDKKHKLAWRSFVSGKIEAP